MQTKNVVLEWRYRILKEDLDEPGKMAGYTEKITNSGKGIANAALNAAGAGASIAAGGNPTSAVTSALIGSGLGALSNGLRTSRQRMIFQKIAEKYPTAADLYEALPKSLSAKSGLQPDFNDEEYFSWISRNVLKTGLGRDILYFLFGSGILGSAYQLIRKNSDSQKTPMEIISQRMS